MANQTPLPGIETLKQLQRENAGAAINNQTSAEQIKEIQNQLAAQNQARPKSSGKKNYFVKQDSKAKNELRYRFQQSLAKLSETDTRDVAINELRTVIERNISQDALAIFLSWLGEHAKNKSGPAREIEVKLVGYIAQIYKDRIIERDVKHLIRMGEIVHSYFKDNSRKVHESAAYTLCDIFDFAVPKDGDGFVITYMFDPLKSMILKGPDIKAQQAASYALYTWVQHLAMQGNQSILDKIFTKIISMFLRMRTDFGDLMSALGACIDSIGPQQLIPEMEQVFAKIHQYLYLRGNTVHMLKIEACKLLLIIAIHLPSISDIVIGSYYKDTITALRDWRTDKVPSVQSMAKDALAEWEKLDYLFRDTEEQKMETEYSQRDDPLKARIGVTEYPVYNSYDENPLTNSQNFQTPLPLPQPGPAQVSSQEKYQFLTFPSQTVPQSAVISNEEFKSPIPAARAAPQSTIYNDSLESPQFAGRPAPQSTVISNDAFKSPITPARAAPQTTTISNDVVKVITHSTGPTEKPKCLNCIDTSRLTSFLERQINDISKKLSTDFSVISSKLDRLGNRVEMAENRISYIENYKQYEGKVSDVQLEANFQNKESLAQNDDKMTQANFKSKTIRDSLSEIAEEPEMPKDKLCEMWMEVLQDLFNDQIQSAYQRVLSSADDIYLLRLIHKTGSCLERLSPKLRRGVLSRICLIVESSFMEGIAIYWFRKWLQMGDFDNLDYEETNVYKQALIKLSTYPTEEGEIAGQLYNEFN